MLVWREEGTNRVYTTELTAGQLSTRLIGNDVNSLVALLDYDGDQHSDIVCARGGALVDLGTEQSLTFWGCALEAVSDVNDDGRDDLASPSDIWLGDPSGILVGGALYADADVVSCPTIYPLGDIDGDGRADFARASVDIAAAPSMAPQLSTLDLYLGSNYTEPDWPPYWRYAHETRSAGRAVTAADVDGDGQGELVILAANDSDGAVQGEIQILDDLLDPLGPTVVSSEPLGEYVTNRNGVYLQNMGDIDADGDDEVLVVLENFIGGRFVTLIDAETWQGGLSQTIGDSFDLPLPPGAELESELAVVGDYDGDGLRDVAMLLAWTVPEEDEFALAGTIAVWLTTEVEHTPDPVILEEQPPVSEQPETPALPEATRGCGCASTTPGGLMLGLLALPWCVSRQRRSHGGP